MSITHDGTLSETDRIMLARPLALRLRNVQSLVEIRVDPNTSIVLLAPLLNTTDDLGAFLTRAATARLPRIPPPTGFQQETSHAIEYVAWPTLVVPRSGARRDCPNQMSTTCPAPE